MRHARVKGHGIDPVIALIDVTFHILIFFMIGGQLAPALVPGLELVDTAGLDPARPPDALVLTANGALFYDNAATDAAAHVAAMPEEERARVRIVADRAAPAARLIAVANELRAAGAGAVILVTEQGLAEESLADAAPEGGE